MLMFLGGSAYDRSTYDIRDYLSGKQPHRQSNCETWKAQSSDVRRSNVSIGGERKGSPRAGVASLVISGTDAIKTKIQPRVY
jgi:hypothetical protein